MGKTERSNGAFGKSDPAAAGPRWVVASELGSERVSNGREHISQRGQRSSFNISEPGGDCGLLNSQSARATLAACED